MDSLKTEKAIVANVLFADTSGVRQEFSECVREFLPDISESLACAIREMHRFEEFAADDENRGKVGHLIYGAVQGSLVSMRLFLDGLLIQSGNTQRQVIESIAMAVLCSKPSLSFLARFSDGTFSSSKAIQALINRSTEYGVEKGSLRELKENAEFYHKFSHPTLMTIAINSSFGDPSNNYYGGFFDPEKAGQYRIEGEARAKFLTIFPNLIEGIQLNLTNDA